MLVDIKKFNYKGILKDINLQINEGEFISLIGSNGSGKTTLSMLMAGLTLDQFDDLNIKMKPVIVFENPDNQIIGTTVKDDIAFGLQNKKLSRQEIDEKIDEVLNKLEISELKERDIVTLSGGQKQKVAFASLLALDYDFYILDEVTSMLDPESKHMVVELIKKLNKEGKTIIQITHFIDELHLADRTILMEDGKIVFDGDTKKLLEDQDLLEKNRII